VPIFNLKRDVIACVQMVLGPGSPKINVADSKVDGINFEQAAEWLSKELSSPLQVLIDALNPNP
jgi:hypothetical protein